MLDPFILVVDSHISHITKRYIFQFWFKSFNKLCQTGSNVVISRPGPDSSDNSGSTIAGSCFKSLKCVKVLQLVVNFQNKRKSDLTKICHAFLRWILAKIKISILVVHIFHEYLQLSWEFSRSCNSRTRVMKCVAWST